VLEDGKKVERSCRIREIKTERGTGKKKKDGSL